MDDWAVGLFRLTSLSGATSNTGTIIQLVDELNMGRAYSKHGIERYQKGVDHEKLYSFLGFRKQMKHSGAQIVALHDIAVTRVRHFAIRTMINDRRPDVGKTNACMGSSTGHLNIHNPGAESFRLLHPKGSFDDCRWGSFSNDAISTFPRKTSSNASQFLQFRPLSSQGPEIVYWLDRFIIG